MDLSKDNSSNSDSGTPRSAAANSSLLASPLLRDALICLALAIVTGLAYRQARHLEFIYFDDPGYVIENKHVHQGLTRESIRWAFLTTDTSGKVHLTYEQSNWHPLTWLSHMWDIDRFGFEPGRPDMPRSDGPHLVNLLLHTSSALLLFLLLRWMTGAPWRSGVVAALFAVHPMHVESVAWVSERKDVLSTFLALLTLLAYVGYVKFLKRSGELRAETRVVNGVLWYLPVFALFALALLAKPMVVTLPCLMLLLDFWPLGRLSLRQVLTGNAPPGKKSPETSRAATARMRQRGGAPGRVRAKPAPASATRTRQWPWQTAAWLVLEKVPLFVLVLLSSLATCYAQDKGGSMATSASLPFDVRFSNVVTAYVRYLAGMVYPHNLAIFYPYDTTVHFVPTVEMTAASDAPIFHPHNLSVLWYRPEVLGALFLLLLISAGVLVGLYYGRRYPAVGWFWFLGTMAPVIGIVQVGDQSMADRYSYFTFTGLFIMVVWGATDLLAQLTPLLARRLAARAEVAGRAALAVAAVAVVAACARLTYCQVPYFDGKIVPLEHSLEYYPDNPAHLNNLGVIYWEKFEGKKGNPMPKSEDEKRALREKAIKYWEKAIDVRPQFSDALNNLGCAYRYRGPGTTDAEYHKQLEKAVYYFQRAILFKDIHSDAHSNLALCYLELGRIAEAIKEFERALEIKPDFYDAKVNIAMVYERLGRAAEAKKDTETAAADYARAGRELEEAFDARHIRAYMLLAEVYQRQAELADGQAKLEKKRDAAVALNRAAWLMATNVDDGLRNGGGAVQLASRAIGIMGPLPGFLDTLAAAWAEVGEFAKAVATAKQAADAAEQLAAKEAAEGAADRAAAAKELAEAIRGRMRLYEQHKPYRDTRR